ncbi:hypothetical protein OH77DRAFT_1428097 [Trametes cingulata]|nr:hypothetical protein OH77DRAFT_1428097 [Trametes cingulata]
MLNLWKQASEQTSAEGEGVASGVNGNKRSQPDDSEHEAKRRRLDHSHSSRANGMALPAQANGELSRPVISADEAFAQLGEQNVIAVAESHEEKLKLLRSIIGQSIATHKSSRSVNGSHSHRFVLFVVDDNFSIGEYATELENEDFTVGAYTVALHSSNVNEWPSVVYNDIVVTAANMLLDSLADGDVKLSQAHLIVVSDAQRLLAMQGPHPVMKLMTDFYAKILEPPRVLAAVTSAPDRWASLDLSRLEIAFGARSYFLANKAADAWFGPLELVVEYDAYTPTQADPPMTAKLHEADREGLILRPRHFRRAQRVLQQLGPFASNLYLRTVLAEVTEFPASSEQDAAAAAHSRLGDMLKHWPNGTLDVNTTSSSFNATPKLAKLLDLLSAYEAYGNAFRGIIIVKDRSVARVLTQILQMPETRLPFVRAAEVRHSAMNDESYQLELRRSFEEGQHNLLVLTRSMEDVELTPASTVISYDLFEDQLAYAYSQARSKGRHSHLIHMAEKGNNEHRRMLNHVETVDADLRRWIAGFVRSDSKDMPPKSLHTSLDQPLSDSDTEDEEYIVDPTTSARLFKGDAEAAIYRFVASLEGQTASGQEPCGISVEQHPGDSVQERYRCIVSLPKSTGIPDIVGPYCATKAQARREAFYRACQEALQRGLMDYRHLPQPEWRPPQLSSQAGETDVPQDVKTANTSSATHGYPRKFPDFWVNSSKYPVTTLYPTVVVPENLADQPHAPIVLLTRAPLPQIPDFVVFFSGAKATARFYRGAPFTVDSAQLDALRGYTNRVVRSLLNKPFDCSAENWLCFFAPLAPSWQPHSATQGSRWSHMPVGNHIPWDAVQLAADYFTVSLYNDLTPLDDNARDAVVQDRNVEFTNRHFLVKVRHDLTPLSKADDSPREAEYGSFLEYCKARRKDFPGLQDEKQPMIEVTAVPGIVNNLHPMSAPSTPSPRAPLKYLIPELAYKFTIPASTFRTLWLLPSILTKIDSYLLVKELDAKLFHHTISEPQLLVALSTRAAWTDANYERLEFLGDAFLKVIASNYLYVTLPTAGEGTLHHARQGIIGNKVLHECAMRVGVCPYVQHKRFVAKLWQPPCITANVPPPPSAPPAQAADDGDEGVEMGEGEANAEADAEGADGKGKGKGKGKQKKTKKQRQLDAQNTLWMGDKVVADVVEAILAAAFLSGGHEVALHAARRLQIPLPNVAQWTDFARIGAQQQQSSPDSGSRASVESLPPGTVEAVQALLGCTFNKPELLAQALTHGSVLGGAEGASYERLEFIGDAILDFLVARHIYARHPHLSPGGLTLLKGAMVSNRALAALCVHAGLHRHLHLASEQLAGTIRRYVDALAELRAREYDASAREERLPGQYWLDVPMEPPKCLSDVVESVVGALYVSDGFFEVGVGRFFEAVFRPFMDAHVRLHTLSQNPKVTLLELLQAEGCQQHAVVKVPQERQNMPVHMQVHVHGQVIAHATDPSAAIATRKVSLAALDVLANDPELLARICDCRSDDAKKQPPKAEETNVAPDEVDAEAAEVEEAMKAMEDVDEGKQ